MKKTILTLLASSALIAGAFLDLIYNPKSKPVPVLSSPSSSSILPRTSTTL